MGKLQLWDQICSPSVFTNKVLLELSHGHSCMGCLGPFLLYFYYKVRVELSGCNGDHMALKAEHLLSGPFQKFANLSCSERTQCPTAGAGRRFTPYSRANKFSALFCFLCCSANSQPCTRWHGKSKPWITQRHL